MTIKLAKIDTKASSDDWVLDKFYRKFGNDELFSMLNNGEGKAGIWWKENVRNQDKGVISTDDFKSFIVELEKRRPKRYKYDDFGASLIRVMSLFGPVTYEMAEEFRAKKEEYAQKKRMHTVELQPEDTESESNS